MRIIKGITGWFCFLALIAAPISVLLWFWAFAWPFLHGATVSRLSPPSVQALGNVLAARGANISASSVMKAFVDRTVVPVSTETGLEATTSELETVNAWFARGTSPTKGMHSSCAAILFDSKDRVVAAYPLSLQENIPDLSTAWHLKKVRSFVPQAAYPSMENRLMVYPNGNLLVENVRPEQRTPAWLMNLGMMTPDRDISAALIRGIVLLLLFCLLLPTWVAIDARWRGMSPLAWGVLVLLTGLIGLLAYLIARLPNPSSCYNCGEKVLGKYVRCPSCGVSFAQKCPKCMTKMKPEWQFCPICREAGEQPEYPTTSAVETITPKPAVVNSEPTTDGLDIVVTDTETGLPLRGVNILVHGPRELNGSTNARGVFTLHRLLDGEYTIQATCDGYSAEKQTLKVTGSTYQTLSISLKPISGKIVGRVTDCMTERAISGASIYLDTSRVDRSATSDVLGAYMLNDVPRGDYTLIAETPGYETYTRLTTVRPGQNLIADLSLTPARETIVSAVEEEKSDEL